VSPLLYPNSSAEDNGCNVPVCDGNFEIYVMNANCTGVTRLTMNPAADASPDGYPAPCRKLCDGPIKTTGIWIGVWRR
jgi:hypothetical protein